MQLPRHIIVLKKTEGKRRFFAERPTKLDIPNSDLMGGSMDGMGDLDAPMPPMGAEDGGMEDQIGNDQMGGDMPMESVRSIKNIIDETINDVLDDREGTKRPEKKMPRQYKGMSSPFKSPF